MENGSFHNLELSDLNFSTDLTDDFVEFKRQPLKTPQPQVVDFKHIPEDVRKSNTVETLISQNEDLMARLKITLRRMTMLEDENKALQKELSDLKLAHASTSDQMLVWKEKEKIWKERNAKAEQQLQEIRDRFPDFLKMEAKIEKLTRYQERVKSTIKPYLQQLKDYASSLHLQIQGLNAELEMRDAQLANKDHEINSLKEKFQEQTRFYETSQNDLIASFENQKDFYQREINALSENLAASEEKAQRLGPALERQDELENLVISLRRNKEETYAQVQSELEDLRATNSELKASLIEKNLRLEDLSKDLSTQKAHVADLTGKKQDLEEQLTSLRYMWSEQSQEKEKMQISISSLEKINLELSTKLSELRRKV